jgi:hypothetical protein
MKSGRTKKKKNKKAGTVVKGNRKTHVASKGKERRKERKNTYYAQHNVEIRLVPCPANNPTPESHTRQLGNRKWYLPTLTPNFASPSLARSLCLCMM